MKTLGIYAIGTLAMGGSAAAVEPCDIYASDMVNTARSFGMAGTYDERMVVFDDTGATVTWVGGTRTMRLDYGDIRVGVQGNRVMLDDRGGEWEYAFFDIERYAKPNAPAFFLWLAGDLFWPVCDDPSYASKVIEAQANIEEAKAKTN